MIPLEVRLLPIDDVKPAAYNPRRELLPSSPSYRKLKRSLTEFGLVEPLVWNEPSGQIVGGHLRYEILCELGYTNRRPGETFRRCHPPTRAKRKLLRLQFEDRFDFDAGAERKLAHAECGPSVSPGFGAEDFLEQIRRAVDYQMAIVEIGVGVHVTRHADDPRDLV